MRRAIRELPTSLAISFLILTVLVSAMCPGRAVAEPDSAPGDNSFLPTWKLLSTQEKQHFLSGYIQGWLDARKVTDIAIDYIRTNPDRAVESLESVRKVYDVTLLKPDFLVEQIDRFYERPENRSASLSMAVTAAQVARK